MRGRANLDTIVYQFDTGASAETIVDRFPALKLADARAVIAYYLNNKASVEDYLRRRKQEAAVVGAEIESSREKIRFSNTFCIKR